MEPKLVRDRIPELIVNRGAFPQLRIAPEDELHGWLLKKLKEEADEFSINPSVEELADILEVVKALAKDIGSSFDEVSKAGDAKRDSNGAFDRRFVLCGISSS